MNMNYHQSVCLTRKISHWKALKMISPFAEIGKYVFSFLGRALASYNFKVCTVNTEFQYAHTALKNSTFQTRLQF